MKSSRRDEAKRLYAHYGNYKKVAEVMGISLSRVSQLVSDYCSPLAFKNSLNNYVRIEVDGKRILEHRYVMEKHLGRKLSHKELVHHKDGNKRNNKIQNLQVFTSQADHMRAHLSIPGYDNGDRKKNKYSWRYRLDVPLTSDLI